jgi:hypothetical protein
VEYVLIIRLVQLNLIVVSDRYNVVPMIMECELILVKLFGWDGLVQARWGKHIYALPHEKSRGC